VTTQLQFIIIIIIIIIIMEEEDKIIIKWAQEDVEKSNNLLNK